MRSRRSGGDLRFGRYFGRKVRFGQAEAFEYIIMDCPPTLDLLQQAVHQYADYAVSFL